MDQHDGFKEKGKEHLVCKLRKSAYGLKQASRKWYLEFDVMIFSLGLKENAADQCIYMKNSESRFVILVLYVDEISFWLAMIWNFYLRPRRCWHLIWIWNILAMFLLFWGLKFSVIDLMVFLHYLKKNMLKRFWTGLIWNYAILMLHPFKKVRDPLIFSVLKMIIK